MTSLKTLAIVLSVLLASAAQADRFAGKVDKSSMRDVLDKEDSLKRALKDTNDNCKSALSAEVDWATFPGKWTNTWHPGAVVGYCTQVVKAIGNACYEGHTARIKTRKRVRCFYSEDLPLMFKSTDRHKPLLSLSEDALHAGYDRRDSLRIYDKTFVNFLDENFVPPKRPPSADDARYMGKVPAEYFRKDMMEDKEKTLAGHLKNARERCGSTFDWLIDWKTFKGEWSDTWNPIGVTGYCSQAIQAINNACYDNYKKHIAKVETVRCFYDDKLKATGGTMGGKPVFAPSLKRKGKVLHIGYGPRMSGFDRPVAEFMGRKKRRKRR